jgi:ketosteroid isomerase-like protein
MINYQNIKDLFSNLENNNSAEFFKNVADHVEWKVMGQHPLGGLYNSKESFLESTFRRLNKILKEGVILKVNDIFIDERKNVAIVEMDSISTAKDGKPFDNVYCWIVHFNDQVITKVHAYVDYALVKKLIEENE